MLHWGPGESKFCGRQQHRSDEMKTNASMRFLLMCGLLMPCPGMLRAQLRWILQESRSANFSEGNEAAIAYQCCINENSSYELDNLRVLLKDRGVPDWPMTEDLQEKYHIGDFTDPSVLEAFFHFEAVQDTSDPTKYMLLVTQPSFPVVHLGVLSNLRVSGEQETKLSVESNGKFQDMEQYDKPSDAEALEAAVDRRRRTEFNSNNPETAGETLRSREALITEAYQTYVEEVIKTMRNVPSLESMEISKEIVHFESRMAKFAEASSKAEDNSPIHSSLRRLIDQYPSVSSPANLLRKYLERNGITIDDSTNVYIAEPKYLELVFTLLNTARRYQVKNYQGWKIIASLAPFVAPLRLQHQEFMRFYQLPKKDKEEICAEAIAGKGSPLEALVYMAYVERKFPLKAKEDVKNLAKQIGYPAWIDKKEHLLHLFNKVGDVSTGSSFIRVLEDYRVANIENSMKKLNSRFSYENEWSGTPLDVTFGYDASSNLMYLPAGFLQPPLYSVDLPAAVNYGTVGLMVAQEMVRAFLKGSSDYGFDTSSRACLRETLKMYIERTYFYPGAIPKSISSEFLLENNEELHEDNYVDKKAIEVAWKAFLKHTKKTISKTYTLDLEKNATREKLFFISVGLSLCMKEPHYSVETQIEESYSKESRINKLL